jgi:hypothetical protein
LPGDGDASYASPLGRWPLKRTIHEKELDMRRNWLFAAALLFLPLAGCTHETTPDEAAKVMATGMLENKPQLYWETLPPSYQKDVDGLVKEFAEKMDPEIWDSGFGIAKKVVRIVKEKKEFLLESPMLPFTGMDPAVLKENWDDIAKAASILLNSDISELDKLKQLNIQEFLSTTGADLMEHATAVSKNIPEGEFISTSMKEMKNAKFTLLKMEGDTATVRMEVPGKDGTTNTDDAEMVKVEGKWILKEVADGWPESMKKAREFLAGLNTKEMQENKAPLLAKMKMIDTRLNLLLDAKTSEKFNDELSSIVMTAMMGGGGGPPSSSFGGDFGPGPEHLGVEEMPVEEGEIPEGESPKKKGFEDKTNVGDDPLFESSGAKPDSDESTGEAPSDEPESETPEEGIVNDSSTKDIEIAAEVSEDDLPARASLGESPAEETKPE